MHSRIQLIAMVLAALACSGCVSMARAPSGASFGADYAEATFEFGVSDSVGFGHATTQEYRVGDVDRFEDGKTVKIFTWAAKKPQSFLFEAGKKASVFARMNRMKGAPGISPSSQRWCINGLRFTPQPNMQYRVVQLASPTNGCELQITEIDSGRAPADLEAVLFPAEE